MSNIAEVNPCMGLGASVVNDYKWCKYAPAEHLAPQPSFFQLLRCNSGKGMLVFRGAPMFHHRADRLNHRNQIEPSLIGKCCDFGKP